MVGSSHPETGPFHQCRLISEATCRSEMQQENVALQFANLRLIAVDSLAVLRHPPDATNHEPPVEVEQEQCWLESLGCLREGARKA